MSGTRAVYWLVVALVVGVFVWMHVGTLPKLDTEAAGRAFDLRLGGYTPEAARAYLTALSPDGYGVYQGLHRWLDQVLPGLLVIALGGALWRLVPPGGVRLALVAVAVAAMLSDYAENALVQVMLRHGPEVSDAVIHWASRMTVLKFGLYTAAVLAVAVAGWRTWRQQ